MRSGSQPRDRSGSGVASEGFSLVELMIVVAIIGLLAAIAIPQLLGSREKAARAKCDDLVHALDSEMVMWAQRAIDAHDPAPTLLAVHHTLEHHLERSPVLRGQKPECNLANRWTYNHDCFYMVQARLDLVDRCQVMIDLTQLSEPSVFLAYRNYDGVMSTFTVSLDK